MISPEGGWALHEAATPPEPLHWVQADGVEVRQSHALLAPTAGLLMPNPWYRGMDEFPYAHAEVLNRGRRAAMLRRPAGWRAVDEPVLALANMDALEHRNYYHWMLLTLSRAVLADEAGLLTDRRLLVPAECSPWMLQSLALAGLGPERCLAYGRDEALRLSDARVVSPALLPSPGLVAPLRARLWRAAGLDPAQPPQPRRALYLTRQGENRRPLIEEAALAAQAEAMGFDVLAPETLSLTDQVRLFAEARAVVGASGAALTNLMWMQPGARVVVLTKEETAAPFWPDLARCNDLSLCWLTGRSPAHYRWAHLTNSPFSVRLDVAETALRWALDGTRPA
jgi:capsular polysaccharide biosynthesis protein